jgi:hypothetical protein
MLVQNAVELVVSIPESWVRVEQLRRIPGGLEVRFGVHKGQRGKKLEVWSVACRGVREATITDLDGGGLAVYPSTHPAARQYVARQAELRWPCTCDRAQALAALYLAHVEAVDDWISFDCYLPIATAWNCTSFFPFLAPVSGGKFVCRGPDFLVRAYAKALEAIGEPVHLTLRGSRKSKSILPRVLHFGSSYIVANVFAAQRQVGATAPSRATVSGRR